MNNAIHSLITVTALLALSLGMLSCDDTGLQGSRNDNQAPNTSLTVDEVNRSGDNRLISQIRLNWWGDDPDGYVTGFEYRINESDTWSFTTRNDSVFTLPIPAGSDTSDVRFEIRAIDNEGLEDPSPADLILPIKNSVPEVSFRDLQTPPDTTFNLFGFGWDANDPDGRENLRYVEIAFNDSLGEWLRLPVEEDFLHFRTNQLGEAEIFFGTSFRPSEESITGIQVNSTNTFYVRVIDQALRESEIIRYEWFVKNQTSSTLVLFDDDSSDGFVRLTQYQQALSDLGYSFDIWNISDGSLNSPLSSLFPSTIDPTLLVTLNAWNEIIWITNDIERNLRFAQEITRTFLADGGKILATGSAKSIFSDDPLLLFLPIQQYGQLTGLQTGFLLNPNTSIISSSGNGPVLTTQRRVSTAAPFIVSGGAEEIYTANFQATTLLGFLEPFEGANTVAVKNPEGNFLFFGFEPADVAEGETLRQLFDYLLSVELNIQPQTP